MASLLRELKDDRAILMMYLAQELPAEDRAAVKRRLDGDAALRAQFDELRQLHEAVAGHFQGAEPEHQSTPADEAAIRRTLREMRRQRLEQAARPAPAPAPMIRRLPAWSYGLLAVAASVAVLIGLWGLGALDGLLPPPGAPAQNPVSQGEPPAPPVALSSDFEKSFHIGRSTENLDEASIHARALADEDENDALLLMM